MLQFECVNIFFVSNHKLLCRMFHIRPRAGVRGPPVAGGALRQGAGPPGHGAAGGRVRDARRVPRQAAGVLRLHRRPVLASADRAHGAADQDGPQLPESGGDHRLH